MVIERCVDGIRYTLSNEGLTNGDKVYPIANGRCTDDGGWILHGFIFDDPIENKYGFRISGFPDEPHTIIDLNHSTYKPYQVRTDYGYGPIEIYYKIIKKEKRIIHEIPTRGPLKLTKTEWVEF